MTLIRSSLCHFSFLIVSLTTVTFFMVACGAMDDTSMLATDSNTEQEDVGAIKEAGGEQDSLHDTLQDQSLVIIYDSNGVEVGRYIMGNPVVLDGVTTLNEIASHDDLTSGVIGGPIMVTMQSSERASDESVIDLVIQNDDDESVTVPCSSADSLITCNLVAGL